MHADYGFDVGNNRRIVVLADVFNLFNSSVVQNSSATYGATWLRPTLVMPARFAKVGVQLDF